MSREFLNKMLQTASVSGNEENIQGIIKEYMSPVVDKFMEDSVGNVISVLNPESEKKVLMMGHIDEIGLRVTYIKADGMLKVTKAGGIYVDVYPGQKVRVITKDGVIYGSVLISRDLCKKTPLEVSDITIDIGADSKEEAEKYVTVGDDVILDTDYRDLLNDKICSRALDDKIGAYVILEATRRAKERGCKAGVYCATTVGEETSRNGAYWASANVEPTEAIAVDVTYTSDYEGTNPETYGDIKLGGGPVFCINPTVDKKINEAFVEIAKEKGIPYQFELSVGDTGTDATKVHCSGKGVRIALVSVPLRYMHSPSEVASMKDVENCIELLAEYLMRK